ncbi:nicotinate-nucleotide--dimethylbenzimidazole phosphoribosyltransferase [Leptothrix ochracea]|uniref:nicotinate-nucleotide--dimethylbenzimidazole phosphoribosyltransferase n=1 Tax=Leptothrix ochracea TaxID=735331 RepID=UPI0034E26A9D
MTTHPIDAQPMVVPIADAALEESIRYRLGQRRLAHGTPGPLAPLEMLALRLALIQKQPHPRIKQAQLVIFGGDHGLAVDVVAPSHIQDSIGLIDDILASRVPLPVLAHQRGMTTRIVDCGLATDLAAQPGVLARKIAHGTRNCRMAAAMTVAQVQAAIRAGQDIVEALPGNLLACVGLGTGSHAVAALTLAQVAGFPLVELTHTDGNAGIQESHLKKLSLIQKNQNRHGLIEDPIEVLAAFGGFETAMMVGAMLAAAKQRHTLMVEGLNACAAMLVAHRLSGHAMGDYCFVASPPSQPSWIETLIGKVGAQGLPSIGLDGIDGTQLPLTLPLLEAASALLSDVQDVAS